MSPVSLVGRLGRRAAIWLVIALGIAACDRAPRSQPASQAAVAAVAATPAVANPEPWRPPRERASIGFRSKRRLSEHYAKHGAEFGRISKAEYLRRAQALRDTVVGGTILEQVRADSTIARFDRASGAFVAFDPDLTIRTFFRPNDGMAYFERQARRRSDP